MRISGQTGAEHVGCLYTLERPRLKLKAVGRFALFLGLALLSCALLILSFTTGRGSWAGVILYGTLPTVFFLLVLMEFNELRSARLELYSDAIRLNIGKRTRCEIALDPSVLVDVQVAAGAKQFKVDPFANCCSTPDKQNAPVPVQPFTGYTFTKGDVRIACSVEEGWPLEDLMRFWPPLFQVVQAHRCSMGEGLSSHLSAAVTPPISGLPPAPEGFGKQFWELTPDDFIER